MKSELIIAIRERLTLGHTEQAVKAELEQAGYDAQTIDEVYNFAKSDQPVTPVDIPPVTEHDSGNSSVALTLPGVFALVSEGLAFVKQRLDLVLFLAVTMVFMAAVDIVINLEITTTTTAEIGLLIATLIGFGFYIIALTASLYVVSNTDKNTISISAATLWARQNALSLVWLWILSTLVVMGGLILLIIPGFILMVYVALAQYVFVAEGKRGIDAIVRSRDLVAGYWWPFAIRLSGVSVIFILILMFIGMIGGLLLAAIGYTLDESLIGDSLFALFIQVFGAVIAIASMKIGYRLYGIAAAHRPHEANTPPTSKKWYFFLAIMAGLIIPISVLLTVVLAGLNSARDVATQAVFMQELSATQLTAESYAASNVTGYSYRGFCATIDEQTITGMITECIDEEDFWIMSVQTADEVELEYCLGSDSAPVFGTIAPDGRSCEPKPDSKMRATDLRKMVR